MQAVLGAEMPGATSAWMWIAMGLVAFVAIPLLTGRALRGSSDVLSMIEQAGVEAAEAARSHELSALPDRRRLADDLPAALGAGPVAMFKVEVDHFSTYVATHGATAGRDALVRIATVLAAHVRPRDVVYRSADSELCVLLAGAKAAEAAIVAERVRATVESMDFLGAHDLPGGRITVSVGLATTDQADPDEFAAQADRALEAARVAGYNRVAVAA